jgi:hypothetical protein
LTSARGDASLQGNQQLPGATRARGFISLAFGACNKAIIKTKELLGWEEEIS